MNEFTDLQIIKASAGSGKTHTLVSSYICTLFQAYGDRKFANILSVTFTNKAAEEMRTRILEALDKIIDEGKASEYLEQCTLDMTDKEVKDKARSIRKAILHDYSYFTVSTIDSFVQRVVRAFAFEFRLPASFQLQLDSTKVKIVIFNMLLDKMLQDEALLDWVTGFMFDMMDEGKSWNVSGKIKNIIDFLFKEDFWDIYYKHKDRFTRQSLKNLMRELKPMIENYSRRINEINERIEDIFKPIENKLVNNNAIPRVFKTLFKFLLNLDDKQDLADRLEKKTVSNFYHDPESIWPKSLAGKDQDVIDFFRENSDKIWQIIDDLYKIYENEYRQFLTAKAIKENFYTIGLFIDLVGLLEEYRKRYNEFLIIDMSILLRRLIGGSEAPFIYEKIGQRLENLLIDEFQDTSRFQWENFIPLIDNSLSQAQGSLIVGDVKQSIYRWRNGDWRILLEEVKQRFPQAQEKVLDTNYRSFKNIVEFNNMIFPEIVNYLSQLYNDEQDELLRTINKAYQDVVQKVSDRNNDHNGLVELNFFYSKSSGTIQDAMLDSLVEKIKDLTDQGYSYSDIGILVRTNDQVSMVVNRLISASENELKGLSIIANVSLLVKDAPAIRLIINTLRYVDLKDNVLTKTLSTNDEPTGTQSDVNSNPEAMFYLAAMLKAYVELTGKEINVDQEILTNDEEHLLGLFPEGFVNVLQKLDKVTLYDRVMYLEKVLGLNKIPDQIPFIRAFEDFVLDFMYSEGSDIKLFLELWEEQSADLTVDLADNDQAMKIMTIHSAKGLAFPVVIIPFAAWSISPSDTIIWAKPQEQFASQLPVLPIKYKKDYVLSHFKQDIVKEQIYSLMDALNLLYVAFTRPREQLIVYASTKFLNPDNKKKSNDISKIGDLLFKVAEALDTQLVRSEETETTLDDGSQLRWMQFRLDNGFENKRVGTYSDQTQNKHKLATFNISNWREKLDIKFGWKQMYKDTKEELRQAIDRGELMHSIMSEVITLDDIHSVVDKYYADGLLADFDPEETANFLEDMIRDAGVTGWFSGDWIVENEMSIILPHSGYERRPDRVIMRGNEIKVIDFKFAKPEKKHHAQVKEYVDLLSQIYAGYQVKGYLLYEDGHVEEVV